MPVELEALVMRCSYCGVEQPVPDLDARRRLLLEHQRETRLRDERLANEAREDRREAKEATEKENERKEARRGRWGTWLFSMLMMLLAPTIIAITVFDAPARLGFGGSGSDRLEQMRDQLVSNGCTMMKPIDSEYTSSDVSTLIRVEPQCIRIVAAGGSGHSSLSLKLFASTGKEVAHAGDAFDPQLSYCAAAADAMRYEIRVGPASKGRLSHMVLTCPEPKKPEPKPKPEPEPKRSKTR